MDTGRLSGFFKRFNDARKKQSAIDAVFFGAVKSAVRKSEMPDERAEFIVKHAGKNNPGKRTGVKYNTFWRAGAVLFNGRQQKFEIERCVVGNQWKFAAKISKIRENGFDSGLTGNHLVGNSVNGRGFRRNRPTGINERTEGFGRHGPAKAHGTDFDDSIRFRLNAGSFQIERNKVHAVFYTATEEPAQGLARFYWAGMLAEEKGGLMKKAEIIGVTVLVSALLCGCNQHAVAAEQSGLWKTDYEAALKQAAAENKYVLVDFSGSDWCGWCIKLEQEVFSQKEFTDYAGTGLICVLVDFPRSKEQPEAQKAANQALAERYSIQGFPTVLILNPQGKVITRDGYQSGGSAKYVEFIKRVIAADQKK